MKTLIIHFCVMAIIYACIYLGYCFITWSVTNPFEWLSDFPSKDAYDRGGILGLFLTVNLIIFGWRREIDEYLNRPKRRK